MGDRSICIVMFARYGPLYLCGLPTVQGIGHLEEQNRFLEYLSVDTVDRVDSSFAVMFQQRDSGLPIDLNWMDTGKTNVLILSSQFLDHPIPSLTSNTFRAEHESPSEFGDSVHDEQNRDQKADENHCAISFVENVGWVSG